MRNEFGLTGAKPRCENGDCGACTVLVDDWPIKSCLMLTVEAIGKKILTVEGPKNAPIQKPLLKTLDFNVVIVHQDFNGMSFLSKIRPNADDAEIQDWLQSNLCRMCRDMKKLKMSVKSILVRDI